MAHGPRCSVACATFSDQGSNPCLLKFFVFFLTTEPLGKPRACVFTVDLSRFIVIIVYSFGNSKKVLL